MKTTIRILLSIVTIGPLMALQSKAAESLEEEARRTGKGAIVLQVGSDWCVSGEKVRKLFESAEFREKAGDKFVLGVYDEMENPTREVLQANERVKSLLVRTKCFPAMTLYSPSMKIIGHMDVHCLPQENELEGMYRYPLLADESGRNIEAEFKKAAGAKGKEAADMYGQVFDRFFWRKRDNQYNPYFKEFTTGEHGWKAEWEALCKLDDGDKYGWLAHFRMDERETVKMVAKLTALKRKSYEEAKDYLRQVKAIPTGHFTPNQLQCIDIMDYALRIDGLDAPLTAETKKLLQKVLALGGDTFWGEFARGRLLQDGEKIAVPDHQKVKMVSRPKESAERIPFMLEKSMAAIKDIKPNAKLSERQKLEIARYAALRLIGKEGWQKLVSRPGSAKFVRAFLDDRTWLEDFAWNGLFPKAGGHQEESCEPGSGAGAILALESLVFQDKGRWVKFKDGKFEDNEGRRFMTALAMNEPDQSEEWLAGVLDAYRATAQSGRLHKSAYSQPVWMWRMALNFYYFDNIAGQQRFMDSLVNVPIKEYHKVAWDIPHNGIRYCFGGRWDIDQVWKKAEGAPLLRYAVATGGGARQISGFAVACANSRGVPTSIVVQPQGHLAYSYRQTDGTWKIDYSFTGPSQMHFCFWPHDKLRRPWQYVTAVESTFGANREVRHAADRMLTLAKLAWESKRDFAAAEKYCRRACALHPGHYGVWLEYESYLLGANASPEELGKYANALVKGYKSGGQPLWDLLTPYFKCVAKEQGAEAVKQEIMRLEPAIKTPPGRLAEEANFNAMRNRWERSM